MTTITETINAQVKSLVDDVKALPETLKKVDVADLQKQAQGLAQTAVGTATSAYADLAKKGEELVAKAKGLKVEDIKKTVDSSVEDVTKQAKGFADDAQKRAEQFVTDAKTQVTKVTSKAPTTVRKAAEKVDTTVKKTPEPAKKAPAKKAPAKKA
jgi:heparin binding hemagglutinin HbhA